MNKSVLLAVTMTALSSSSVFAGSSLFGDSSDDSGAGAMYGGASIGQSSDANCDATSDTIDTLNETAGSTVVQSINCKDSSAWKVFAGYKVAPNLAVEGSYTDYGKATTDATIPVIAGINNVANPASVETSAKGFGVSGVASTPVTDELSVFGKMGVTSWEKTTTVAVKNVGASNSTVSKDIDSDGVDLSLGAGAEYKINDNWGVRGEYEHVNGLNANMYSVGAVFSSF